MTDDPEVRRLLDQAALGFSPSVRAKERVRAQLAAALANDTTPPFDGHEEDVDLPSRGETTAIRHAGLHALHGAGLLLLGLVVGGLGGYSWRDSKTEPVQHGATSDSVELPTTPAAQGVESRVEAVRLNAPSSIDAPSGHPLGGSVANSPTKTAADDNEVSGTNDAGRRGRAANDAPQAKQLPHSDADEIVWVQRVQKALVHGEARLALGLLRDLDSHIPVGRLAEERFAGRALARCMLEPETGLRELQLFTRIYPNSVHLSRVKATCSGASKQTNPRTKPTMP